VFFLYNGVVNVVSVAQVGLSEEDLEASLETLHMMAAEACAKASVLRRLKGGSGRRCAIVHVTGAATRQLSCTDLRIAGGAVSLVMVGQS
jgi:GTPase